MSVFYPKITYFSLNACYHIKSRKHLPHPEQNIVFFKTKTVSFSQFLIPVIKTDLEKTLGVDFGPK